MYTVEPEVNKYHMVELSSLLDQNTIVIETFSVSIDVDLLCAKFLKYF